MFLRILLTASLLQIGFADYSVKVLLQSYDVGQGYLANKSHCNEYYFAGISCYIELKACVQLKTDENDCPLIDLGLVSENSTVANFYPNKKYGAWDNPYLEPGTDTYLGFGIRVEAYSLNPPGDDDSNKGLIDSFFLPVADGWQPNGSTTLEHPRPLLDPTSLKLAWIIIGTVETPPPITTTAAPSTTEPEVVTVETTEPPEVTTPRGPLPSDCDGIPSEERHGEDVYELEIDGKPVSTYCLFGSNGAYTVIQNRGEGDTTPFDVSIDTYKAGFGTAGRLNNFWLGLDSMNKLTTGSGRRYNLLITVCCNSNATNNWVYNVTVGDGPEYTLDGTSSSAIGVGARGPGIDPDLGAKFSLPGTFDYDEREYCEVIANASSSGGWWFRSCANNPNGKFVAGNSQCVIGANLASTGAGIEFWTVNNAVGASMNMEGKSYTRTRMALYRAENGQTINGFPGNHLCL